MSNQIQVYLRIRPPNEYERSVDHGPNSIAVNVIPPASVTVSTARSDVFTFDHVGTPDTTQDQVFEAVGKSIVERCLEGYNGTIFAYGQTSSGKTYTIQGPGDSFHQAGSRNWELRGLIPRCLEYLFEMISQTQHDSGGRVKFLCRAAYMEIYNESIYDLLDPMMAAVTLREDIKKGVFVDGITEETIGSPRDAYVLFERGANNRHVSETAMNRESSRSHAVLQLTIQSITVRDEMTDICESRFNLVDLAGSERQKLTGTTGMRLKEAANINKSLSSLGSVINALVDVSNGRQRHVHYRDSKLTFLLRDSLGGNSVTYIIANVSPSLVNASETLSTLRFAARAKMIQNKAVVNHNLQGNVTQLQEEIRRLRHELEVVRQGGGGGGGGGFDGGSGSRPPSRIFPGTGPRGGQSETLDVAQHRRIIEMLVLASRKLRQAGREKSVLSEELLRMNECNQRSSNTIQSLRMIIKLREERITQLSRLQQSNASANRALSPSLGGPSSSPLRTANSVEDTQQLMSQLKREIMELQRQIENHPEVTRFALENLQLREELDKLRRRQRKRLRRNNGGDASDIEIIDEIDEDDSDADYNNGNGGSGGMSDYMQMLYDQLLALSDHSNIDAENGGTPSILDLPGAAGLGISSSAAANNDLMLENGNSRIDLRAVSPINVNASGAMQMSSIEAAASKHLFPHKIPLIPDNSESEILRTQLDGANREIQGLKQRMERILVRLGEWQQYSEVVTEFSRVMATYKTGSIEEESLLEHAASMDKLPETEASPILKILQSFMLDYIDLAIVRRELATQQHSNNNLVNEEKENALNKIVLLEEELKLLEQRKEAELDELRLVVDSTTRAYENAVSEHQHEATMLREKLNRLDQSVSNYESELTEAKRKAAEATRDLAIATDNVEQLEKNLKASENTLAETRIELNSLQKQQLEAGQVADNEANERTTQIEQLNIKIIAVENEKKKIEEEMSEIKGNLRRMEFQLEMAQDDNNTLMSQIENLSQHMNDHNIINANGNKITSQSESTPLSTPVKSDSNGQNRLSMIDPASGMASPNAVARLKAQIADLVKENEILSKDNRQLRMEVEQATSHQNTKQKVQYQMQIKKENNELRLTNQRLEAQINQYKQQLASNGINPNVSFNGPTR
ncbi:kinesin-domain-containing protein [Ramicandelaber brevisporus]|nr:kinesin-domain-containing protein [Ramicandelaber brevisporus]